MRLPRDLTGMGLVQSLKKLGYHVDRQTGSHIRLTCEQPTQHHITIPNHDPLRLGTLASIIDSVAKHHNLVREDLLKRLFL